MMRGTVPAALRRHLPCSIPAWSNFLRRALERPVENVPFPDHFFLNTFSGNRFSPHKPLLKPIRDDISSAVLLLLCPSASPGGGDGVVSPCDEAKCGPHFQDLSITFTKRSMKVRHHRGEVSFPGGHLDEGETARAGAIRETWEEVGVRVREEWVVGQLTTVPSAAGYAVSPVVALSPVPLDPQPASPDEVDSIHYLHISNLLLRSAETHCRLQKQHSRFSREPTSFPCFFASSAANTPSQGVDVRAARFPGRPDPMTGSLPKNAFPGEVVWGLTSFIVCEFVARLAAELNSTALRDGLAKGQETTELLELGWTNIVAEDPEGG